MVDTKEQSRHSCLRGDRTQAIVGFGLYLCFLQQRPERSFPLRKPRMMFCISAHLFKRLRCATMMEVRSCVHEEIKNTFCIRYGGKKSRHEGAEDKAVGFLKVLGKHGGMVVWLSEAEVVGLYILGGPHVEKAFFNPLVGFFFVRCPLDLV